MRKNEPVSTIMTPAPVCAHPNEPLSEVRATMAEVGCHHVPVVSGGKLLGMITSTDLLRASYTWGEDPRNAEAVLDHTRTIEDLMVTQLVMVGSKTSVREATRLLVEHGFHSLPVVDDGVLVGIVTTNDVLRYLLDQY